MSKLGSTGKEIDFIYEKNNGALTGIEVKYREDSKRDILMTDKINEYLVLTKSHFETSGNILFIPATLFLVLLKKSEKTI